MLRTRPTIFALAILISAPLAAPGQDDGPKAGRAVPPKVGDRVVLTFGANLRATKEGPAPVLQPPAPGDHRNAFRVYRVERVEAPWAWLQAELDGVSGWAEAAETMSIDRAFERASEEILANPDNSGSFINRAILWSMKGEIDLAIADYDEAIRLDPVSTTALNNRGGLRRLKGETDRAIDDFTAVLRIDPSYAAAYCNRGITWKSKDIARAIDDFTNAIRIDPEHAIAHNGRGNAYREKKELDRAIADFTKAIQIEPRYSQAYANRGMAHRAKNDYGHAISDYSEAVRIEPKNAWALNNLAWLLSICPESKSRDGKRAIEAATHACELTKWKNPNNIDTLAAACAETGDFDSAVRWQEKVQPLFADEEARKGGKERLDLYRSGKPYRELVAPEIKRRS